MHMISLNASLLLTAALATAVIVLVTGGARIQAENYAQTELRIANVAFTNDVDNAATVYVRDDTRLTLTSTTFLPGQCRVSEWFIAPSEEDVRRSLSDDSLMSLRNTISVYPTEDCNSGTPSVQDRIAISAMTEDSLFTYKNVAHVPLVYSNGIVTSIPDVSTPAAVAQARADLGIDAWYTVEEMTREVPRVIQLNLTAIFPLSDRNETVIKATTNEAVAELVGDNDNIIDPPGEQVRWVPNPVSNVLVERSTTTGAIVGGEREGIRISWQPRPASECAPVQTATYMWLVTNDVTGGRSSGETTGNEVHVATGIGGDAEVWNGGDYTVQVAVRCNDTDGQSTDRSTDFILPLPPVLGVVVTADTPQTTHEISWQRASSDPSTRYTVQDSPASVADAAAYARSTPVDTEVWLRPGMTFTTVAGSPTPQLSIEQGGNTVVPGYPDTYQVRASTDASPNTTGIWSPANYIYRVPAPASPVINQSTPTAGSWQPVTCVLQTSAEYRAHWSNTFGGVDTTPSTPTIAPFPTTSLEFGTMINEGSRVWVRADARCVTRFTLDPTNGQSTSSLSPYSPPVAEAWDRPITPPAAPTVGATTPGSEGGTTATTRWSASSCAVGTTLTYEHEYTGRTPGGTIPPPLATASTQRSVTHSNVQGTLYDWRIRATCSSTASGSLMSEASPWSVSNYYTEVTAPTVTITRSTGYNVPVGTTVNIGGSVSCVNGASGSWTDAPNGNVTYSTEGTRSFQNAGRCIGANGRASAVVQSAWTSAFWYAIPPNGTGGCLFGGNVINNTSTTVRLLTCGVAGSIYPQFQVQHGDGAYGWTGTIISGPVSADSTFISGDAYATWGDPYGQRRVRFCSIYAGCGSWSAWAQNPWIGG
jgi:hypothetical protein